MWNRNSVWKNCWLPVMRELILLNRGCETGKALNEGSKWGYSTTAKELGSVLQFISNVYKHTRFCFEEPRGKCLETNFARLFGRHLSRHMKRLAAVFVGTS